MKPNFYSRGSLRGAEKILLFSFFVMFLGTTGYAQGGKGIVKPPEPKKQESLKIETEEKDTIPVNAYYLAKDLYSFLKTHKPENAQKDSTSARKILSKLCYYLGTDEPDDIREKIKESYKMKDLLNHLQTSAEYISDSIKIYKILTSTETINKEITDLKIENDSNQELWKIINEFKTKIDHLSPTIRNGLVMIQKDSLDTTQLSGKKYHYQKLVTTIKNYDSLKVDYSYLSYLTDSIQKAKKDIDLKILAEFKKLDSNVKQSLVNTKMSWSLIESFIAEFSNRINAIQQQDAQITISLLESSASSVSGWKIPSEAEMIDAVATYIASRVKQETVLWFFDQMRNNTERYDLIMTAFPETMNLIQSSEVFDAPNMGSAWKYALSKDFIHLPKNILSSEWINQRIPEDRKKYLELACVSWEISELISNRLSYRDMIKQLYLKRNLDDHKQIDNFPDSVITFLYAVSNELFIVSKGSVRNLTYEEINSMPYGQLEIMLELLNMKYSNSIDKLFLQKFEHKITKDHKKDIAKWIGNTMLALSQFDKIMQQVEQSRKGNNGETVLFDGYNTWNLISQVIRSSLPARKDAIYKKYLDRADDAFEIYHLLSEKNYAGAVSKTFELIDSLIYNRFLTIDPSRYMENTPFYIPVEQATKSTEQNFTITINDLKNLPHINVNKFERIFGAANTRNIHILINPSEDIDPKGFLNISFKTLTTPLKQGENRCKRYRINNLFRKYLKKNNLVTSIHQIKRQNPKISFSFLVYSVPKTTTYYIINVSDLDNHFKDRHIKHQNFPKIAEDLKKGVITVKARSNDTIEFKNKKCFSFSPLEIELALKKNEFKKNTKKIERLFNDLNKSKLDSIIRDFKNWGGQYTNDSMIRFPINSIAAQALISSDKKVMQMIMKLASFLNDVSQSDNERELKKVIESYALPPGSYKQKRNAWHSLTFNAFAGPYAGFETSAFFSLKENKTTNYGATYGISAPIGITYTKTFGKEIFHTSRISAAAQNNPDLIRIKKYKLQRRSNVSLSISLSFVDIGAVVSYRMSNTEGVLDQSFKWEQFVSPGLHFGLAIPKTPLVAQFGYQYTPRVRRIFEDQKDAAGNNTIRQEDQIGMWRAYIGVFFDIPLVNLWMKTRSVKFE